MKHAEAQKLLHNITVMAQKARSNLAEAMAGNGEPNRVEKAVLFSTNPHLFPEYAEFSAGGYRAPTLGIMKMIEIMREKEHLEPIDLYNLLIVFNRIPALVLLASAVFNVQIPETHPIPKWLQGWDDDEEQLPA